MSDTDPTPDSVIQQQADAKQTVTNDAVSGETVLPGSTYAGPTGAEPLEAEPEYAENDLAGQPIDLDDTEDGDRS
ncbi:MAG TPA: hypothetical protein VN200_01045 [Rhodoglobus sp.]|nr:hypothetical protein [Rhodoglobus sp.]